MHDSGHTGKNLDRRDPCVFFEGRRKCYAFPFDNPARGNWISGQIEGDIAAFAKLGVSEIVFDFRSERLDDSLERMERFAPVLRATARD